MLIFTRVELVLAFCTAACLSACTGPEASDDRTQPTGELAPLADAGSGGHVPEVVPPGGDAGTLPSTSADSGAGGCQSFDSSFAAIQKLIFERHGCTASACHGQSKVGGLDLRAEVSFENLVDARSRSSPLTRVQPGTATDSFLYKKLLAATNPGSAEITGSPMPVGAPALSNDELEAVRLWILKGAPKTGIVADQTNGLEVGSLLHACLPPATPIKTKPLDPPAPDEGVQMLLPRYVVKAGSEAESCTPFAYDFSDKVPAKYKDVARSVMYINGSRVRQDPASHHLVVWNPAKDLASVSATDPDWKCHGGSNDGKQCNAQKGGADCGADGVCAGKSTPGTLCNFDTTAIAAGGPLTLETIAALLGLVAGGGIPSQVANTQSPQQYTPPLDGVFQEIPIRGVLWFNSHAFNLTEEDTLLEARVNYYFAKELRQEMRAVNVTDNNHIADGLAPFTKKTFCGKHVVTQGYSLAMLTGHTHRRGERFWVNDSTGKQIYESFKYNDPEYKHYEPWLTFDSPNAEQRTLEYCATYNNGLKQDGSPDLDLVTRASRMPAQTSCTPVACVAGRVMAACSGDRDCDSAPGANDGDCDACAIRGGQTTENEMFVMMPWFVLPAKP